MSRSLLRTALELRSPITRLPPAFLLPSRARWLSTTTEQQPPAAAAAPPPSSSLGASRQQQQSSPSSHANISAAAAAAAAAAANATPTPSQQQPQPQQRPQQQQPQQPQYNGKPRHISRAPLAGAAPQANTPRMPPTAPPPAPTGPIPETVKQLLPLLRTQPAHYITVHIHGRPYLVTPGDSVRLPFLMPGVSPGDVLRLNRASLLGSRDFTLRPTQPAVRHGGANEAAYIDERVYECRATVVGVDSEPMRTKEKTKRRNRKVKTVKTKLRYTVVRISELKIRAPEEIED